MVQLIQYLRVVRKAFREIDMTPYLLGRPLKAQRNIAEKLWLGFPKPGMISQKDIIKMLDRYYLRRSPCKGCEKLIRYDEILCRKCKKLEKEKE